MDKGDETLRQERERREDIEQLGSSLIRSERGNIHTLTIIGQVEGHQLLPPGVKTTKYEHVLPMLATVEESDEVDGLLVLLNTVGGDIEAGLGMAEMIAGMSKSTVSLVLGGGHSIGVPLAVAARTSFIAPSASMTLHPVRLSGTVIGVSQMFDYFQKTQDRILDFITAHSAIDREALLRLMLETGELTGDIGTILRGEEAVQVGLIDRTGTIQDALEELHRQIGERKSE